jgi:hypothetical protein
LSRECEGGTAVSEAARKSSILLRDIMMSLELVEKVVEKAVDEWQHDWSIDVPLHQYLGWEYSDYVRWVETGELPLD